MRGCRRVLHCRAVTERRDHVDELRGGCTSGVVHDHRLAPLDAHIGSKDAGCPPQHGGHGALAALAVHALHVQCDALSIDRSRAFGAGGPRGNAIGTSTAARTARAAVTNGEQCERDAKYRYSEAKRDAARSAGETTCYHECHRA